MKKHLKKILVSSLTATAFAAMTVGTTFALFTSKAESHIEIGSGKVEVSASLAELVTYSAAEDPNGDILDENNNKYSSVATAVNGVFTNTGTASFNTTTGVLTIDRMTPGDRVVFELDPSIGGTNVTIKLRYSIIADQEHVELVKVLDFKMQQGEAAAEAYHGLAEYYSDWVIIDPSSTEELDPLYFDISMPMIAGNKYQDLSTSFVFSLEAVQGNAVTSGEKSYTILEEDIVADEVAVEDEPTVISGGESVTEEQQVVSTFEVTVPANAAYGEGGSEQIEAGNKVELQVTQLATTESQEGENQIVSLNFDAKLLVNEEVAEDFEDEIQVKIYVGENKAIASVKHKGQPVSNYTYENGYIIFSTNSFSPFSVEYFGDGRTVGNLADLKAAVANEEVKAISLTEDLVIATGFDASNSNVGLSVSHDLKILGNGHSLTMKGQCTRGIWVDENDVTLELNNLTIKGEDTNSVMERGLQVNTYVSNATIKADGLTILNSTYYAFNVCVGSTVNVDFDHCDIRGWGAINLWCEGYIVNIRNSKLVGTNDKPYNAEGWNNFGVIVLEGDTTGESEAHADNCVVNLYNCEIDAEVDPENLEEMNTQWCILFNESEAHNKVTAIDCTFKALFGVDTAYNVGSNSFVQENCTRIDYLLGTAEPISGGIENPPFDF